MFEADYQRALDFRSSPSATALSEWPPVATLPLKSMSVLGAAWAELCTAPATGLLGAPAVLIGVGAIGAAQLLFTYAPFMQVLFATRAISLLDGVAILGIGVALFIVLEFEKLVRRRFDLWVD